MQVDSHAGMKTVLQDRSRPDRADRARPAGRHLDGHRAGFSRPDRAGLCRPGRAARRHLRAHDLGIAHVRTSNDQRTMTGRFITLEGGEGAANPPRSSAWPRRWKRRASPCVDHARAGRLAGRGGNPQAAGRRRARPLGRAHRNAAGLCRARRSCRAHHRSGAAGGQMGDLATASPIPPMPIRARAAGWRAKPSAASTALVLDDFRPDLTLILDLDVETGLEARHGARAARKPASRNSTREFHERLRQAFLDIARRNPDRCVVIDAARKRGRGGGGDLGRRRARVSSL